MEMVEVKTAELSGAALDWAVAATGAVTEDENGLRFRANGRPTVGGDFVIPYEPSVTWSQCGPLIDAHAVMLCYPTTDGDPWEASCIGDAEWHFGSTPQIAICRAIVAAKLGETVSVPKELLQ